MSATCSRPSTIAHALARAQQQGLTRLDAQLLLLAALDRAHSDRAWLVAHDDLLLAPGTQARFNRLCRRRLAGVPLAYLTGRKPFYGLTLHVDARVLDPRSDTETLVDWALTVMPDATPCRILDLGTGSGAIALALAQQRPMAEVWGSDASRAALQVAAANAQRLGLAVSWRHGHWLQPLAGERFDLIVSNPPYVAAGDPHLLALQHEPQQALIGGADGLDALRTLCAQAPAHLRPGGWLLLEHGHDQAGAVRDLLRQAGLHNVQSRRDLAGVERCSGGQLTMLGNSQAHDG